MEKISARQTLQDNPILLLFIFTIATISIYFLAQIIGINLIAFFGLLGGWSLDDIETWLETSMVAEFVSYVAVAIVGLLSVRLVLKWTKTKWVSIGMKTPHLKDILYALMGYGYYLLLYIAVSVVMGVVFPTINFDQEQQLGFDTAISGTGLILVFFGLVILPPLYEEILTRGLLYTGLRQSLKISVAAIVTSIFFAVAHLQWGSGQPLLWAAAIDTFVLSMVLVYLREKTGSLWPSIGLHAIKNMVAFTLLFIFKLQ